MFGKIEEQIHELLSHASRAVIALEDISRELRNLSREVSGLRQTVDDVKGR